MVSNGSLDARRSVPQAEEAPTVFGNFEATSIDSVNAVSARL